MRIKTSELIGEALNYAVAIIEYGPKKVFINPDIRRKGIWVIPQKNGGKNHFHPSKSWAQGGAIIKREKIGIKPSDSYEDKWLAKEAYPQRFDGLYANCPLIAAMRCYVASRLGNEVEVPDELV
jgi:hypothetical protein